MTSMTRERSTGDARLLVHLRAVARITDEDGGSGMSRLEAELGADTAARLVASLSGRLVTPQPSARLALR